MNSLELTAGIVIPMFLLMLCGGLLRAFRVLPESAFSQMNRLCFTLQLGVVSISAGLLIPLYNIGGILILIPNKNCTDRNWQGTIRACAALMILRQGISSLASRRANRLKRNNKQFAPVT
ncbi:MAG: hypothetical protein IJ214_12555 [Clostridia bacterium]|nr:hypothetical protein [Clostridia bacterium]